MPDIYWGEDATAADFLSRDNGGDLVLAETTDGNVLLVWNATAGQWEYGGPVDLGGNDLSGVSALTAGEVDTEKVTSDSLPTYRAYSEDSTGDTVVVDDDGEVARNSDASTALQTAIDDINSTWENGSFNKFETIAVVDGGMDTFSLASGITVKDGVDFRNFRFGGSGVGAAPAVTFGGPDDTFTHGGVRAKNIIVVDAGDIGVRFRDVARCTFRDIYSLNATSDGFMVQSTLSSTFDHCISRNAGGQAWAYEDDGNSGNVPNANLFSGCQAANATNSGFRLTTTGGGGQGNVFIGCIAESNGSQGLYSNLKSTYVLWSWFEQNDSEGVFLDEDDSAVLGGHFNSNDSTNNRAIRLRGLNQAIHGPLQMSTGQVFNTAGATDARLWGLDSANQGGAEGTRITYDGVGQNSGDPNSTGDWNGNGREGVVVVDTTNSVVHHYRGGGWV